MKIMNKYQISAFILIILCLCATSGCAQKCETVGCENNAIQGYNYCETHKCATKECDESITDKHLYCDAHLCQVAGCENETDSEHDYCIEHMCTADGCDKQKEWGDEYCIDHVCKTKDCHIYVDAGQDYCEEHRCKADQCKNERISKQYCDSHTCKRKKCNNYVDEGVQYCVDCIELICRESGCNEDKIKGFKYCKEHKCHEKKCGNKVVRKEYCKKHFKAKLKAALSKLKKHHDNVEDVTWYNPSCVPKYINSSSTFYIYLGRKGDQYWLRWKGVYLGDDWVFFDNIVINVDGEQHRRSFRRDDLLHDNAYGNVWEVFDIIPSSSDIELLEKIAESNSAVIRYKGDDYNADRTITAAQKQCIKDVLAVWKLVS